MSEIDMHEYADKTRRFQALFPNVAISMGLGIVLAHASPELWPRLIQARAESPDGVELSHDLEVVITGDYDFRSFGRLVRVLHQLTQAKLDARLDHFLKQRGL